MYVKAENYYSLGKSQVCVFEMINFLKSSGITHSVATNFLSFDRFKYIFNEIDCYAYKNAELGLGSKVLSGLV